MRKSFSGNASITELTTARNTSQVNFFVADGSNYPDGSGGPFVIVVNRGEPNEEKVLIASRSGNTLTAQQRGYDGTPAQSHAVGSEVQHVLDAVTVDEANAHANNDVGDVHTQYLNTARHDVTARHTAGTVVPTAAPGTSAVGQTPLQGSASTLARSDHRHGRESFGPANANQTAFNESDTGTASTVARSDHRHVFAADGVINDVNLGGGSSVGGGGNFARSAHQHGLATAAAGTSAPGDSATQGSADSVARSDHRHARESFGIPTQQTLSGTASGGSSATLARSDHGHSFKSATVGETTVTNVGGGQSAGVSDAFARGDHAHGLTTGTPVALGPGALEGSGSPVARASHVHPTTGLVTTTGDQTMGGVKEFTSKTVARVPQISGSLDVRLFKNVAALNSDEQSQQGAVLIRTGITANPMVRINFRGFIYATGRHFVNIDIQSLTNIAMGGRAYVNYGAVDMPVRGGFIGSEFVFVVGNVGDTNNRPKYWIDVMSSHPHGRNDALADGWSMEFRTNLSDIDDLTDFPEELPTHIRQHNNAGSPHPQYALTSTSINSGDGLTGGGNLSNNRTLAVDSTVVRTTGAQTVSGQKSFLTPPFLRADPSDEDHAVRKLYLDSNFATLGHTHSDLASLSGTQTFTGTVSFSNKPVVPANSWTTTEVTVGMPVSQTISAAQQGSSSSLARSDHGHSFSTAAPVPVTPGDGVAVGTSTSFARADHRHNAANVGRVQAGIYTGNGTTSRTVSLPFTPKFVDIIHGGYGSRHLSNVSGTTDGYYLIDTANGSRYGATTSDAYRPLLLANGFRVSVDGANTMALNRNQITYSYVAYS